MWGENPQKKAVAFYSLLFSPSLLYMVHNKNEISRPVNLKFQVLCKHTRSKHKWLYGKPDQRETVYEHMIDLLLTKLTAGNHRSVTHDTRDPGALKSCGA